MEKYLKMCTPISYQDVFCSVGSIIILAKPGPSCGGGGKPRVLIFPFDFYLEHISRPLQNRTKIATVCKRLISYCSPLEVKRVWKETHKDEGGHHGKH